MKRKARLLITVLLTLVILAVTGCAGVNANSSKLHLYKETKEGDETTNVRGAAVSNLWINNNTGNITVCKTSNADIRVKMLKKVQGNDKSEVAEVFDTITAFAEVRNGRLEVEAATKEGKADIWSWLSNNHSSLNVNVDFVVEVPENFKNYIVNNVAGNITAEDITGNLNIENMTGNINLKNTVLTGENSINLSAGNIDMDISMKEADSLEVIDGAGNVTLTMPADSKVDLNANVGIGNVGGNFNGMESKSGAAGINSTVEFNGGGKNVSLKLTTGNITVNSR